MKNIIWVALLLVLPFSVFGAGQNLPPVKDYTQIAWNVALSVNIAPSAFLGLLRCESGLAGLQGKPIWGDRGESYGIAQFKKTTFDKFAKMYGLEEQTSYKDYASQIVLAGKALADGYAHHWMVCSKANNFLPKDWTFAMLP